MIRGDILSVELGDVEKHLEALDFDVLRVNVSLPLPLLISAYEDCKDKNRLQVKDGHSGYRGVCLQVDQGQDAYGALNRIESHESQTRLVFADLTPIGEAVSQHLGGLKAIGLSRGRLLEMQPEFRLDPHRDRFPRLHIALVTSSEAIFHFGKKAYHIPADGYPYLLNTTREHAFENHSTQPRAHYVFDVLPYYQKVAHSFFSGQSDLPFYQALVDASRLVLKLDVGSCQACGRTPAHSVMFLDIYKKQRLIDVDNLFCICHECESEFAAWCIDGGPKPSSLWAIYWMKSKSGGTFWNARVQKLIEGRLGTGPTGCCGPRRR